MNSARNSNRFMLFLMLYQIAVSIILIGIPMFSESAPQIPQILVSQIIFFIFPCIFIAVLYRKNLKEIFPFKNIGIKNVLLIIALCLLIQPVMMLLSAMSAIFFENYISESVAEVALEGNLISLLSVMALTPAICEEMAMRGVVFSGYKNVPIVKAALINGLFFGIMHLNPQQFLYTFVLGIIFACFVRLTGSLLASMLGHFTINAAQSSLLYFTQNLSDTAEEIDMTSEETIVAGIVIAIIAALFTLAFTGVFYHFIKHNKKRNNQSEISNLSEAKAEDDDEGIEPEKKEKIFTLSFWLTIAIYVIFVCLIIIGGILVKQ